MKNSPKSRGPNKDWSSFQQDTQKALFQALEMDYCQTRALNIAGRIQVNVGKVPLKSPKE